MTDERAIPSLTLDWRAIVACGLWSLTGLLAVVLAGRAAVGAFDAAVPAIVPCMATGVTLVASLAAWFLYLQSSDRQMGTGAGAGRRVIIGVLSLTPAALIAGATTVNASPFALGLVVGLLTLGLSVVIANEGFRISYLNDQMERSPATGSIHEIDDRFRFESESGMEAERELTTGGEELFDPVIVQQITRRREHDGSERIDAVLRATFGPDERETVLHLPIHPALVRTPYVECEPLDDSPVSMEVTETRPYGVRIEIKRLTGTGQSLSVPIGIEISAVAAVSNVA